MDDVNEIPNYEADHDGSDYVRERDHTRLSKGMEKIFELMRDDAWRIYSEISYATGVPENSVSAHLRSFRKRKFGAYTLEKRYRGSPKDGLWEFRLGGRGTHTPQHPPLRERADFFEEMASVLAEALEIVDPGNGVLVAYQELMAHREGQ